MLKKVFLGILVLIILVIISFIFYVQVSWNKTYDIAYPDLEVSTDSTIIARGKYLVHGPAHCSNCHVSSFDEMIKADNGENVPLQGGVRFPLGPLGKISPANLTSDTETGLGRYEDGQVFRMMRHAVKPDGTSTLALMMPFWNMADDDLVAVVSYLRTLPPLNNKVEPPNWTLMGKVVKSIAPAFKPIHDPTPPKLAPAMEPTIERGEYISRYVANCVGCHTPRDPATFEAIGPEYSGGMEMEPIGEFNVILGVDPDLWTRSPNITPHPASAFSKFKTLDDWKSRWRQGRIVPTSPMHWGPFSRMSDEDLEALWIYLNSLEPVENEVGDILFKKE